MVYKTKTEDVSYFIVQVYNQNFHIHGVIMHTYFLLILINTKIQNSSQNN